MRPCRIVHVLALSLSRALPVRVHCLRVYLPSPLKAFTARRGSISLDISVSPLSARSHLS